MLNVAKMKMKMKIFILAALILINTSFVIANSSPFQSMRFLGSARATALAGAFVSIENDPAAIFYNPATLFTVKNKNFSTTFFKHVLDINSGQLVYKFKDKQSWASDGIIAASIAFNSFGSFEYADEFGYRNGSTFGANDITYALNYSNELDSNLYYGVSTKFLFLTLEKANTFAIALDAGLLYQIPDKNTNIGISILHVGSQITNLNGEKESLPLDIRLGINHRLRGLPLLLNFSFHHLADETEKFLDKFTNFSIGGEIYFGKYIQLRLGYDNQIRRLTSPSTDKRLSGFTAGLGLQTENFNLGYGIAQMGNSAILHRFTLDFEL